MMGETLRAVLASARDGVVVIDLNGMPIGSNDEAERLLGIMAPIAHPEDWPAAYGIFLPDGTTPFPSARLPLVRAFRGEISSEVEAFVRNERVAGRRVLLSARPIQDDTRTVRGGVLTCREAPTESAFVGETRRMLQAELSTTRVAREQAERASELKTEFLGMVSHEFRTPLTALRLQIEALERHPEELRPRQLDAVRRLARSSSRLEDLVESLLEYARIQAGCIKTKLEEVDLTEIVHDVIEECRPRAELRVACDAASPHLLRSDPCLVRIVISNLVDNAIKFTDRGAVEISLSTEPDGQRIGVRDTGRGIAPADLERIFEPFEQVSHVRNKTLAGVGLGLALVREIVSALGGRIDVSSTLGVGSAFTVLLPNVRDSLGQVAGGAFPVRSVASA